MASTALHQPPSPPFVSVVDIPNFRDLGGYATITQNHSIRRGMIYRCGEPSALTDDGIATVNRLGIKYFYDLRSLTEIKKLDAAGKRGVVEWDGCERVFVPVFIDENYSPESIAIRWNAYATGGTEVRVSVSSN